MDIIKDAMKVFPKDIGKIVSMSDLVYCNRCKLRFYMPVKYLPITNPIRPFKYKGSRLNRRDLILMNMDKEASDAIKAYYTPWVLCPTCSKDFT